MDNWYYVDRAQTRHGPVAAAAVADAYRNGQAGGDSLVWREGMAEWQPLDRFRDELGLGAAAPVAASPGAGTPPQAPAKKGTSGCLIISIVLFVLLLFVGGILAAIAIPAYQDYVERAKQASEQAGTDVEEALRQAEAEMSGVEEGTVDETVLAVPDTSVIGETEAALARQAVTDFIANTDRCPRDSAELGLAAPSSPGLGEVRAGTLDDGRCTITLLLSGLEDAPELAGSKVVYTRESDGSWTCRSNLSQQQYLAPDCR